MPSTKPANRYATILAGVFKNHFRKGATEVVFERSELEAHAKRLRIEPPKNWGDLIYSFRYRAKLPKLILDATPKGHEWIIEGAGRAKYRMRIVSIRRIDPREDLLAIKIPDSTPEIISAYALGDEQALLAKVRYNRLIDIFLGLTAYSLQNHLRTTVKGIGQIEIDEIYIGLDRTGTHFVVPVQAKGGKDKHSVVQSMQDVACCEEKFPSLTCRPVCAQFMAENVIAMFELDARQGSGLVVQERHFKLVPAEAISKEELEFYARGS